MVVAVDEQEKIGVLNDARGRVARGGELQPREYVMHRGGIFAVHIAEFWIRESLALGHRIHDVRGFILGIE